MKKAKEILTSTKKFHIKLGLERIGAILELLGNPQDNYKIIHVAGTNGKGSTCRIINEILIEKFKNTDTKIGLFTSPHLFSYKERIAVNNSFISDFILDELTNKIEELAKENDIELTEFELITAVAFYYFYIKQIKYLVLEVGLGGEFDATNIIKKSMSVITSIDLDHTERLGKTIREIAKQKAGIIKPKSKVVVLKENKGFKTIEKIAKEKNAKIILADDVEIEFEEKNYALVNNKKFEFNLLGDYQAQNLALALKAINSMEFKTSEKVIKEALKKVQHRARLEYQKEKNIIIDGAHNPHGASALREFLDKNFKNDKKTFIFGCLKNKEYEKMLNFLIKPEDNFYLYEFDYPNSLKYDDLPESLQERAITLSCIEEVEKIIKQNDSLKIITGSLYMIGTLEDLIG